jgi:hypothetical protein
VNFTHQFKTTIALLGVRSRDGRLLSRNGTWAALLPAPVMHTSSGTEAGWIEELEEDHDKLVVLGVAMPGIADALNAGMHALAFDMDNLVSMTIQPENTMVIESGRLRSAFLVKMQDWLWS